MPGSRPRAPGDTRSREAQPGSLPGAVGAVGAVAGHPAGKTHSGCNSNQDAFRLRRLDLEALRAEPGLIEELSVEDLPALLEICAVEHGRVAAVERLAHGRLARELPDLTRATEGLLTARQAARRLGVSVDYLRDHGEALRLAVPLDGVVRYDPVAIDRLRRQRRDQLPRD